MTKHELETHIAALLEEAVRFYDDNKTPENRSEAIEYVFAKMGWVCVQSIAKVVMERLEMAMEFDGLKDEEIN